jgi:hypothetical protein
MNAETRGIYILEIKRTKDLRIRYTLIIIASRILLFFFGKLALALGRLVVRLLFGRRTPVTQPESASDPGTAKIQGMLIYPIVFLFR